MDPLHYAPKNHASQKSEAPDEQPQGDFAPPNKRLKQTEESVATEAKTHTLILTKFGIPYTPNELKGVFETKCHELFKHLEKVEEIKKPSFTMLFTQPAQLVKSFRLNNIAARSLDILEFGQQKPDWYDRMSKVWEDFGEISEYSEANKGSLARGSYIATYNALVTLIESMRVGIDEVKIEHLAKLLFYVDCFINEKSAKPSYQSTIAITLFEMHTLVRKLDLATEGKEFDSRSTIVKLYGLLGITSDAPRDYLFLDTECGNTWTQEAFEKVQAEMCALIEKQAWDKRPDEIPYQALKDELIARIASYHKIIDIE